MPGMPVVETDAVVLRTIRYGEADAVLTVYTRDRGRASVMAKGARRSTSKLGGRLQPGVWAHMTLQVGRGDMFTVRGASVVRTHAGLWVEGGRLRAAGCVLEAALRVLPEAEGNEEAFALLVRTLDLLSHAEGPLGEPRLHPLVLGFAAKLLVVSGLLPQLGACSACGAPPPLSAFSPSVGGVLCAACARGADPLDEPARLALAGLIGSPLAEAGLRVPPAAALGVERVIGLVLREHLGVTLRSMTPV
jgi:DNA repair protein RecO (recombination protein O)